MAAINFPANPSNGDTHQGFVYNSTLGVWQSAGTQTAVTSFTGLSDTPSTLGTAGQIAKVNSGGTALEFADQSGVTVYANVDALPGSGNAGDLAFVTATNRLYIWNGSGWYNIALINTSPSISGVSSSYALATDGTATTITIVATDPEGLPITYSIASDTSGNIATVTQGTGASSNVFTITPSTNSANGGTFSLTFRASDGVNVASAISSFTLQFIVENSNYTTALITSVGANNAVNNTFVDSSTNSHTITAAGNATQLTFSPHRQGGYSTYFDGSGDYINFGNDASLSFGTGEFTIECWIYRTAANANYEAILSGNVSGAGMGLYSHASNNTISIYSSASNLYTTSTTISNNTWHHICATRNSSNVLKIYIDGTEGYSGTVTDTFNMGTSGFQVGADPAGGNSALIGYIRDVRLIKGSVVTPPSGGPTERLTAITNTSLLTCHLPYIVDGSSNAHTGTVYGNTTTEPFGPYDSSDVYAAGTHGGSFVLDGTGDYVSIADHADLDMVSSDFTIEGWYYPRTVAGSANGLLSKRANSSEANGILIYFPAAAGPGVPDLLVAQSGSWSINSRSSIGFNTGVWNHFALVRNGTSFKLYINGKTGISVTSSITVTDNAHAFVIGAMGADGSNPIAACNIADFRVVKGTAVYTADFTPPTAPLTAITNTSLLISGTNAGIIDKSQSVKTLTLNGSVSSSTTQTKYLSSSMYFNGTSDYITVPKTDLISNWNSENFTVEAWVYPTASSGYNVLFSDWGPTPRAFATGILNGNWYFTWTPNGGSTSTLSGSAVTLNQWYHFAVTKSGTTVKIYIDGTLDATQTGVNLDNSSTHGTVIGSKGNLGDYFNGYVSDLRFSRGVVRYTTNFTPPTAELKG